MFGKNQIGQERLGEVIEIENLDDAEEEKKAEYFNCPSFSMRPEE